jgi:ABC-type phosphate transport system permease subunit
MPSGGKSSSGGLPVTIYRAINALLNAEVRVVSQEAAVYLKLVIFIIENIEVLAKNMNLNRPCELHLSSL